jgi:dienelactone hydrolase
MRSFVALLSVWAALAVSSAADEFVAPSKLPSRPGLPDPLVMLDGTRVTSRDEWATKRRPELRALFEHYMYGRCPAAPEHVVGKTLFEDRQALGGKATLKEVEISFGPPEWPKIYLLVATPNGKTPAACFVGANFGGNHLATIDERVRKPTAWTQPKFGGSGDGEPPAPRGSQGAAWPLEQIVDRGYAVATFYCGDVQPDRPDVREGMRATLPADGAGGDETATIMWWAWGVSRAVDYLVTDKNVDPKRIAVMGHSRLGKTALLAGALDERIALVVANQAGCGGSGPSRHDDPKAEAVAIINEKFPHWFCRNFHAFGDDPSKLPIDQNCLVALCAPRPVLFTAASGDKWANPSGQFDVLKAATPAYELLGVEGLSVDSPPAPGGPMVDSRLGYWIRRGEHAVTPVDWNAFLGFADKWLK